MLDTGITIVTGLPSQLSVDEDGHDPFFGSLKQRCCNPRHPKSSQIEKTIGSENKNTQKQNSLEWFHVPRNKPMGVSQSLP